MADVVGSVPLRLEKRRGGSRRRWAWVGIGLGSVGLAWGALRSFEARQYRSELDLAKQELKRGRHSVAGRRLARLSARWPGDGEVDYLLGTCERGAGRPEQALAAWNRVRDGSSFAVPAILSRAQLELSRGRFSGAEQTLLDALATPRPEALGIRHLLVEVLWHQGRYDELKPLLETNWEVVSRPGWPRPADAIEVLRSHLAMDLFPLPVDRIRTTLDHAEAMEPNDDRVWLAQANFATRTGNFTEAGRRLDLCLGRRRDDPAVWRARLDWAKAAGRVEEARAALAHLPADGAPPDRVAALRAWFAARRADEVAERCALEGLAELDPGNTAARQRLAELAVRAGRPDHAAALRRRKAELDLALNRYRNLLVDNRMVSHANEMSALAKSLGRRFEARAFNTLAARRDPANPKTRAASARLGRGGPVTVDPRWSLAALIADEAGTAAPTRAATTAESRGSALEFRDDAGPSGLAFVYDNGETSIHQLPETAGGGVGVLDYDGDGLLDVYVLQGGAFPPNSARPAGGDRLFRNNGDGTFDDVTNCAGLAGTARGYGHGVAVGDIDNDGHPDLFVTRWRSYALYHNNGDGTFEDVTAPRGLDGDRDWPTSAAFADLDNDGDLDLYVCHYAVWDPEHPRLCPGPGTTKYISCAPHIVEPLPDHVFRNDGDRFVDVTAAAGFTDRNGRGLGVVAADLDGDGNIDVYVANDGTANYLFRNLGGFHFEEVGHTAGVAASAEGGYQAGMGVACGDLDADGLPDLAVTNFYGESTTFYQNLGGGQFADRTMAIGLAAASRYLLGFGIAFLDADNDGWLDLMTANGHVSDSRPESPYAMPVQLLRGGPGGRLTDASARAGPPFLVPHLGRALAAGDLDDDGRVDALVIAHNEPLLFLHNRTDGGHFLTLHLEGTTSNRDAVGARVAIRAGGQRRVAQRKGGGSYQAAGDPRLHFGLGDAARVDALEVRWPSGRVDQFTDLAADTAYLVREGARSATPVIRRVR